MPSKALLADALSWAAASSRSACNPSASSQQRASAGAEMCMVLFSRCAWACRCQQQVQACSASA